MALTSHEKKLYFDTIFVSIVIFIIIAIDYYTQNIVASCSNWFCESGKQPVVKGITEFCAMILIMMVIF